MSADRVVVTVRARGETPVPWAGRSWPKEPTTIQADRTTVADLLRAPASLAVTWPEDFVAPDGSSPGAAKPAAERPDERLPGDSAARLARAEDEAARYKSIAQRAEAELLGVKSDARAAVATAERLLEEERDKRLELEKRVSLAEQGAADAGERVEALRREHAEAIEKLRSEHAGELDTLRASTQAEIDKAFAEADRKVREAQVEVESLRAELDKATAPKGKPKSNGG